MNDLRYNMYGGARYPAPAVVGGFGAAHGRRDGPVARRRSRRRAGAQAAPPKPARRRKPSVEVYRGTTSNQYKVGGYGR